MPGAWSAIFRPSPDYPQMSIVQPRKAPLGHLRASWIVLGLLGVSVACVLLIGTIESVGSGTVVLAGGALFVVFLAAIMALLDIRYGLAIFLIASALSPRLGGSFRLTDPIVPLLLIIWGGQVINGGTAYFRSNLTLPVLLVSITMLLSTFWGLGIGQVPNPMTAFFIVGKRIEYFALFFLALNTVRTKEWGRALVVVFLAAAVGAAMMSFFTAETSPGDVGARGSGMEDGNYNTYAGFLAIAISMAVAGAMQYKTRWLKAVLVAFSLFLIFAMFSSYSREGYILLGISLLTLGILRYRLILPLLALVVLASPYILPESVISTATDTVTKVQNASTDDPGGNSLAARYSAWEYRWNGWFVKHPYVGNGVGSIPFTVDNEYLLRMVESGLIGFACFLMLKFYIGRFLWQGMRRLRNTEAEPFAYGLFAAFVALLVQGYVAASFSTIRTMEPFWLLLGGLGSMLLFDVYRKPVVELEHNAEARQIEAAQVRKRTPFLLQREAEG
jgi:hypothetical protein